MKPSRAKVTPVELAFRSTVVYWRGPSPWYFVPVPAAESHQLRDLAPVASYGWGCIPVEAQIADSTFTTSLFPKDGGYLVPVKAAVRRVCRLDEGAAVAITLRVQA